MANDGGFQAQVRRLGELVTNLDKMPDSPQKAAGKELVQLLMEVHGQALERMIEMIFESREGGSGLIDRLGKDEAAGGLLLLYSLHPDALETRVQAAMERMRARLRKLSCSIELLGVEEGAVKVRVMTSGHMCGSSAKDLREIVENGVYELAPDVSSLEILGLEEPSSAGFVSLDKLAGHAPARMDREPAALAANAK